MTHFSLRKPTPHVDFSADLINASLFTARIGMEIRGHLRVLSLEVGMPLEITQITDQKGSSSVVSRPSQGEGVIMRHAQRRIVHFRQNLLPAEADVLLEQTDKGVTFAFDGVDVPLWFLERPLDGEFGQRRRRNLGSVHVGVRA